MKLINKTISMLRQKTIFGRPIKFEIPKQKNQRTQEEVKQDFISNSLHDDALKRHKDNKSLFVSLYWDKIFFNKDIKETRFLANEYDCYPFKDSGKKYQTRLHYYYEKGTLDPKNKAKILEFQDVEKMKSFFAKIDKVPNWDSMKYREKIMRTACEKQVVQNVHFARRLARTGDYTDFIYLNFKDGYFGTGLDGKGYNRLGAILTDCRRMLTDKVNNGFVILFSAIEWVHPDKEFRGMTDSVWEYVAKEFSHSKKNIPDPKLNPGVAKTIEENVFDVLKIISEVNSQTKENGFGDDDKPNKVLQIKLNPMIMDLINQKEERTR